MDAQVLGLKWYQQEKQPHETVFSYVLQLQARQGWKSELNQRHYRLFGNQLSYGFFDPILQVKQDKLTFNIVQSCCSTLVSKICKNKPRPMFLTDEGNWEEQKLAKKLNKFSLGQFYATKTFEKTRTSLLHATVFGDGFIKVFSKGKKIVTEYVLPFDLIVDDRDALYGKPSQLFQVRLVDREALKEMFPEFKTEIQNAPKDKSVYINDQFDTDLVSVVEAWKIKQGEAPGKHFVGIHGATFVFEDYERERFPFAKLGFEPNITGFWSKGVSEIITPHQIEINRNLKRISQSLHLVSSPKVLIDYASKVISSHINNDIGAMLYYTGTPPQFITPSSVAPELFTHLQFVLQRAYEEVGISALSATSRKPEGLDSGKALREFNDIETERFARFAMAWEEFHLDIADLMIQEAREMEGSYTVLSPSGEGFEKIRFKDVNLDRDSYIMQCYPTSMLPKEPAGRLAYVQELINGQMIEPADGLSLLEFPDVARLLRFKNAGVEDIHAIVDMMLEDGEYLPPEQYQNLQYGVKYIQGAYLYYKRRNVPQDKLDLLVQWINDALDILTPPQPTQSLPGETGVEPTQEEQDLKPEQPSNQEINTAQERVHMQNSVQQIKQQGV